MIIAGNWKMNLLQEEARALALQLLERARKLQHSECWVAPAYTSISTVVDLNTSVNANACFKVGAQNVHWENAGAFTGEISAAMLNELGCSFVIVGHSERRQYFGETNDTVRLRAQKALDSKLDVIVCVGENLEERETGLTNSILHKQLSAGLAAEWDTLPNRVLIAYEPVWAIGTGKVASISEITAAHEFIANTIKELGFTEELPILYGGSVKPSNFKEIASINAVGGALVGGASLEADSFCALLDIAEGV